MPQAGKKRGLLCICIRSNIDQILTVSYRTAIAPSISIHNLMARSSIRTDTLSPKSYNLGLHLVTCRSAQQIFLNAIGCLTEALNIEFALNEPVAGINGKPDIRTLAARSKADIVVVEEGVEERLALLITFAIRRKFEALSHRERLRLGVFVADASREDLESGADVGGSGGGKSLGLGGRVRSLDAIGGTWASVEHAFLTHVLAGVVDEPAIITILTLHGCDSTVRR